VSTVWEWTEKILPFRPVEVGRGKKKVCPGVLDVEGPGVLCKQSGNKDALRIPRFVTGEWGGQKYIMIW